MRTEGMEYDNQPSEPGWYGVSLCWDAQEGVFPAGTYWTGAAWREYPNAVIGHYPKRLESQEEAEQYARDRDPEDPTAPAWSQVK